MPFARARLAPTPWLIATLATLALALVACDSSPQAPTDAGPDSQLDAGPDSQLDAGLDVQADLGGDTEADVAADTMGDAGADVGPDASADTGPDAQAWTQPFDPTVCDAAPYTWLPPGELGQVVSFEPANIAELTREGLDALLAQAGYTGFSPVPYGARMYLLRYTTQDRGVEVEATAAVAVPMGYDPGSAPPLAMWLHGTSGFMDDCAPSRSLEGVAAAALLASLGYVTVAPDYVGMLGFGEPSPPGTIHPYLAGESVALSSWDALRAARAALTALNDGGEAATPEPTGDPGRTVLWGGSQGGHAVFFVDRYAPYYASEFHLVAAVAAVPATDLVGLAQWGVNELGDTTVALAAAMTALRKWYTGEADMGAILTDQEPLYLATNLPVWMSTTCQPDVDPSSLTAVTDIYTQAAIDAFSSDPDAQADPALAQWVCYMRENSVDYTSVPRANDTPYLATFSELDELVITEVERASMSRLCDQGYRIQYLECAGEGHTGGARAALQHMKAFADARLAGEPMDPANTCVITPPVDCEATAP